MRERSPSKFLEQLRVLVRHEIDFIVVGGVAAVFEGAPIVTLDLDIVYDRSTENIPRLEAALRELNALYDDPAGRRIVPDTLKLETLGLHGHRVQRGCRPREGSRRPADSASDLGAEKIVLEANERTDELQRRRRRLRVWI